MDLKQIYKQLKTDYPEAYTALAILPVSGQALAISDYAEAMQDGDSPGMALAAASLIPGVKLAKHGAKLAGVALSPPQLRVGLNSLEKAIAPVTRNADKIGKGAAIQQVAEYDDRKPVDEVARDRAEYDIAWNVP